MRILFVLACLAAFLASDAVAHGGSFRGPNGGVPPGLRPPGDPEPPPPPPTDPDGPGGVETPRDRGGPETPDSGPETPGNAPPPTPPPNGPKGGRTRNTTPEITFDSWRFWWAYNSDDILNLKSHLYRRGTTSASGLHFTSKQDENNRTDARLPTRRAIVERVIPALEASLNRPGDNEDIHGGALVALGKIGAVDLVPLFEAAALNRHRTDKGVRIDFGHQATESAVLALGLLPDLDARAKAEVRRVLLGILDNEDLRSRERAWAAVCLGLQKDVEAVEPLWERLDRSYTGTDKYNVPAGILCGLGLIGNESIRERLETLLKERRIGRRDVEDRVLAYVAFALAKIASPKSCPALHAALKSRRLGRFTKRSVAIACGTCAANADPATKDETVRRLRRYIARSGGDQAGEHFAIIALSQIGTKEALDHLLKLADSGKYGQRPYAALGLATHVWYRDHGDGMDVSMRDRIRETLVKLSEKYNDAETKAAMMLSRGLLRDRTAIDECVRIVSRRGNPVLRGFCCVALGLIGEPTENVKDALQEALRERTSTELRRDAATALGLMRDADLVPMLVRELERAKSFTVQGQLITAIGTIGDHRAVAPLIEILDNTNRPAAARAMAAVGLGMIGDLLPLPRLSRLSKNYNYRATVPDLDELLFIF